MSEPSPSSELDRPLQILLVEDDPDQAKLFPTKVRNSPIPYQFTIATTAPKALELITAGLRPDLVIADYNLPGMNGVQLIEAIRDNPTPSISSLPIVLQTDQPEAVVDPERVRQLTGQPVWSKHQFAINLKELTRQLR